MEDHKDICECNDECKNDCSCESTSANSGNYSSVIDLAAEPAVSVDASVSTKDDFVADDIDKEKDQVEGLTRKDVNKLIMNQYGDFYEDDGLDTYILRHKKSGKIVELKASSAVHACKLIGWRPRQAKIIKVIPRESDEPQQG